MKKRWLSLLLALCVMLGMLPMSALATEGAPALSGGTSDSVMQKQGEAYTLDLSTVFTLGETYTVSVNGEDAKQCSVAYEYSCETAGTYTLVFKAQNTAGESAAYTVTLLVIHKDAVQDVDFAVKGGVIEWFAFTDDKMNPLPEGTSYHWDAETTTFTITQPTDIQQNGKVMTFYKLTKDTAGAKLPLLTGTTATAGAGTHWDEGVRDRQTNTLANGEVETVVYLYENSAGGGYKPVTIKFDYNRVKPEGYFEYKITDNATYTIIGDEGGVNGHCWINANEVHIALSDNTPADAAITLQERSTTTALVEGFGEYKWSTGDSFWGTLKNWTVQYKIDNFPTLADGHATTGEATVLAKSPYEINLATVFADPDTADTLTYQAKIDDGGFKDITGSTYSYTPDTADVYTIVFRAYDGFVYSEETYTVTLSVVNSDKTYEVTVNNLPNGAKFYANNGFNSDGTDIHGAELTAQYAEGAYTVKVPANVSCIGIDVDGSRITAQVSESANVVTMQKTSFDIFTKAGNTGEASVAVTYGDSHTAVGVDNVFYLVAGDGYTFTATPIGSSASMWIKGTLTSQTVTEEAEHTFTITLEVKSPKTITVDSDADLNVYYQNGYYKVYPIEPAIVKDNGDGTTTYTYSCPNDKGYSYGYMYFATKGDLIDKAGYMMQGSSYTVTWEGETRTSDYRGTYVVNQGQGSRGDDSVLVNVNSRNHLVMDVGETYRLRAFRIWQIINTDTENCMIEPQFTYEGYDESIISMVNANEVLLPEKGRVNGTGGNNWMDITAESAGTTFMEVGYEAIHLVNGYEDGAWGGAGSACDNDFFNAVDPSRTALIVIQTDGNAAEDVKFGVEYVSASAGEWDAEFDTLYFIDEKSTLNFNPSALSGIQSVAVSYDKGETWKTLTGENGRYTMDVYAGNNVIRIINGKGQTAYQVVHGDQITYDVSLKNDADKNGAITPGDTVRVTFHGLHNPVGKMSGIYNPGYGHGQLVTYTWNGSKQQQNEAHQYDFVSNAWIEVTIPEDATGEMYLTGGYIDFNVFGDVPGNHRALSDDGRPVNMSAGSSIYNRSTLPDIKVYNSEIFVGDMNGDEKITATDVNMLIEAYRAKKYYAACDMNGDNKIDATDVNLLIETYRNKA